MSRPAHIIERLEQFDDHAGLRNALRHIAKEKNEWAGVPMPLTGERLVLEPSYPYADLSKLGAPAATADAEDKGLRLRSRFWSTHRSSWVLIIERANGTITHGLDAGIHHLDHDLHTLGCSDAWGIEQESTAVKLLGTLVRHRAFKQYMLTGAFLETSRRSGVTYMFRRLKPTVALSSRTGHLRILCTLCLHPIGYYDGSWAGSLCPTDDVIAHLMLMRGDEAMFWRRANHHPAWVPEAGL